MTEQNRVTQDEAEIREAVAEAVRQVRIQNPMAGSITNNVTIDFVANAQLAVGGSAAMVYMADEAVVLGMMGGAMYMNLGTLTPVLVESIPHAARALHEAGKPYVIDPVGIGIGENRTQMLLDMKECKPSIIRGNASEVIALAGLWQLDGDAGELTRARGVDTTDAVDAAVTAAVEIARFTGGAVAVSGEVDLVTDGTRVVYSEGGSAYMGKVTGCGCSLGGVVAVYAAVTDPFTAALAGTAIYNLAGSRAQQVAEGPASFKVAFLDALYNATPEDVAANPLTLQEA